MEITIKIYKYKLNLIIGDSKDGRESDNILKKIGIQQK